MNVVTLMLFHTWKFFFPTIFCRMPSSSCPYNKWEIECYENKYSEHYAIYYEQKSVQYCILKLSHSNKEKQKHRLNIYSSEQIILHLYPSTIALYQLLLS